jgi:hypothetical protein
MESSNGTWQAPGPGLWERDESHQSAPFSRYTIELFQRYGARGTVEAGQRYGLAPRSGSMRTPARSSSSAHPRRSPADVVRRAPPAPHSGS